MFKNLTWNLIQNNKKYYTVHIEDIIHFNTEDELAKNENVTFINDNIILSGTILLSSDDHEIVLNEQTLLSLNYQKYNWFLVKYKTTTKNLLHLLIEKNDINWANSEDKNFVLRNGKKCYFVFGCMTEEDGLVNLSSIKENIGTYIFQATRREWFHENLWLLVQYSTAETNFIYDIIKASSTTWKKENKNKNIIAYLRRNDCVFQSKILKQSDNFEEVLDALQFIHRGIFTSPSKIKNKYYRTFKPFIEVGYEFLSNFEQLDANYYYHHDGSMLDYINETPKNTVGYRVTTLSGMFYTDPIFRDQIEQSDLYIEIQRARSEMLKKEIRLKAKSNQVLRARLVVDKAIREMKKDTGKK